MTKTPSISPWRVLLPVALGTGLSLIGDTSLYAVLPTSTAEAGVTVAGVGILLSANRFIRLILNAPIGWLYDRFPRRYLFVTALFIGAGSTAIYALTLGFWPLLAGRLLWGLAWSGIWVGGNSIILDISHTGNRGRWIGIYQAAFFLGASGGAMLGGFLTDWLGYHQALGIGATLTLFGAIVALIFLPETRNFKVQENNSEPTTLPQPFPSRSQTRWPELASAMSLLGVNRLVLAGILLPTLGLLLLEQVGESVHILGYAVGVATLTGIALGANGLISMLVSPVIGWVSDKTSNRWQAAAGGLLPGIAGFGFFALGSPLFLWLGIPLTAVSSGSNQGLSTTLVGDLSSDRRRGRNLGLLFTLGDLTSAIGPPLTYGIPLFGGGTFGLIPWLGLSSVYLLSSGVLTVMFFVAMGWVIAGWRTR